MNGPPLPTSGLAPPAAMRVRAGLVFLAAVLAVGSTITRADDNLTAARGELDEVSAGRLTALAEKCRQLGLPEQAELTRRWIVRRDPRRRYVFLVPDSDPTKPPADAPDLVHKWHKKFTQHRAIQAEALYQLAQRALAAEKPTLAYTLMHEVLRENPDHEQAREILGYREVNGRWRLPGAAPRVRRPRTPHPKLGYGPREYWWIDSEHFCIATNHSAQAGLELARQLEELHGVWRQLFVRYWSSQDAMARRFAGRSSARRTRKKHEVVLFDSREEYLRQLRPSEPRIDLSVGIYLHGMRKAFFYQGGDRARSTRFHEVTHQLFHETGRVVADVASENNFWLVEGIALYIESLARHEGYYTLGGVDAERLQYARYRALSERFYVPLTELAGLGQKSLQQDTRIRRLYSQAAGLTHFLMHAQQGRYRPALVDCLRGIYQGRDDVELLASLCGVGYQELDAQYQTFLGVSDADLASVKSNAALSKLSLGHTAVTDRGLAHLAGCNRLEWIDLAHTKVTDEGLAHLAAAVGLKQLSLDHTSITDAALLVIGKFTQLEELDLSATRITDAGLEHLKGLKQLELLDLSGTPTTAAGRERLKQSLPQLK